MSSDRTRRQRERRKMSNRATRIVNREVSELRQKLRSQFVKEFCLAIKQAGSLEVLHKRNMLNRPKSKNAVQNRQLLVVRDFTDTNTKGVKAYPFKATKLPIERKQSKLRSSYIESKQCGNRLLIRVSNSLGNQMHLADFGFQFSQVIGEDGKIKRGWHGEVNKINFAGLVDFIPECKVLFQRFL